MVEITIFHHVLLQICGGVVGFFFRMVLFWSTSHDIRGTHLFMWDLFREDKVDFQTVFGKFWRVLSHGGQDNLIDEDDIYN